MLDLGTGYRPDGHEQRDLDERRGLIVPPELSAAPGLVTTDNRKVFSPPRRNQKKSNYCVRFSTCRGLEHLLVRAGRPALQFSPLFQGWNDAMPGDQGENVGTQVYLAAAAANKIGVCSESLYPFELAVAGDYLTRMKVRPGAEAFREAERHQVVESRRLPDGDWPAMLGMLQRGIGIVFGMPLRTSFFTSTNGGQGGVVDNSTGKVEGWHAMYVIDAEEFQGKQYVVVDGSWAEPKPYLIPVGAFGTNEFRDLRVFIDIEELKK